MSLNAVVEIQVDDEALVGRVSGRYHLRRNCGEGYHDESTRSRPRSTACATICGGDASSSGASDDNAETVRSRLVGVS